MHRSQLLRCCIIKGLFFFCKHAVETSPTAESACMGKPIKQGIKIVNDQSNLSIFSMSIVLILPASIIIPQTPFASVSILLSVTIICFKLAS